MEFGSYSTLFSMIGSVPLTVWIDTGSLLTVGPPGLRYTGSSYVQVGATGSRLPVVYVRVPPYLYLLR
jgi:hypothetical protein